MNHKKEIRDKIRELKKQISEEYVIKNSEMITQKILDLDVYKKAKSIYIYLDFEKEVMTKKVIQDAYQNNKKVAVPKIINNQMKFYYLDDLSKIKTGYFGIKEPVEEKEANEKSVLMIMPGLAFDEKKNRVGYGKSFYDRYLCEHVSNDIYKLGVCFDFQVLDKVPVLAHDIPLDKIITQSRIF